MINPLTGEAMPIIVDDVLVNLESEDLGKCVKVTPFHDFDDYAFGTRHHIRGRCVIDASGHLCNSGKFSGMERFAARQSVIEELDRKSLCAADG